MPEVISCVADFVAATSKLQCIPDLLSPLYWFRGHARKEWTLHPGVLRDDFRIQASDSASNSPPDFRGLAAENMEKEILAAFRREGASLMTSPADLADVYFLAQHHGLPTRLLDWSANPLAALFFAVSDHNDSDAEVIAACPDWRLTYGSSRGTHCAPNRRVPPVDQRDPLVKKSINYLFGQGARPSHGLIIPLRPDLRASRMLQQGACFTLHAPGCRDICEGPEWLHRYSILAASKGCIEKELRALGVTRATLFPDLDHLSLEIRARWR